MKKLILILSIVFVANVTFAQKTQEQQTKPKVYVPMANAKQQLDSVINKAKIENKHVFVQVGGNWCKWCIELHKFMNKDFQIDSIMKADYVVYYLNYSKEDRNEELMKKFEFPQRFGFPVILILNAEGKKLHTQQTDYFEGKEEAYSKEKVFDFLKSWNVKALSPSTYAPKK